MARKKYLTFSHSLAYQAILMCTVFLLAGAWGHYAAASSQKLLAKADSAYNAQDYHRAVALYQQAIDADGTSPTVLYNQANAYYRLGQPGRAVLGYERALRLDPSMVDARANLQWVRTRIEDKPEDDTSFLTSVAQSIRWSQSADAWAWTALGCFIVLLGAVALYIFATRIPMRKAGFFGAIIMFFITVGAVALAISSVNEAQSHDAAVVMVPTANLTTAPRPATTKTDKVIPIHEGTCVWIVDSVATPNDETTPMYYDVKINNSTRAWARSTDIERI